MIQPGLERVSQLLKDVQFPWKAIHVAGTNGKGSICHHASSLLRRKLSRVGKFTSPHVVDRWDCISINGRAVNAAKFKDVETHYMQLNQRDNINASQYEILTATAFTLFNMHKVDVGVIEVGMGGKLDATNILNNQVISVISKIARDHEGFLGNTLEEIATHKAGILRPNVPYIVNPKNEFNVSSVIDEYAKEIGAGPRLFGDTPEIVNGLCATPLWRRFAAPLRPFQQDNAILAIVAVIETLNSMGITITHAEIGEELIKPRHNSNPGRFQYIKVPPVFGSPGDPGRSILVDGAHNPDAATALEGFVSAERTMRIYEGRRTKAGMPVTWVLAMTEGKDARKFLEILLRATDNIITTTFGPVDGMPWVKPMDPQALLDVARSIEPRIKGIAIPESGVLRALCAAKYITEADHLIVLTGSLYLGGDFQREMR
ncbi:Mur ligase, partial [Phaeosphaeriaceae sp. PMI808]